MESRNMSEKEFEEFQKLLERELGAVEPAKEDEEIAEMFRKEERPERSEKQSSSGYMEVELSMGGGSAPVQEQLPEEPVQAQPEEPVTRGKYEKIPDAEELAAKAAAGPRAEDMVRRRGKYEKPSGDEEGYFNPEPKKETAAQRRQRARRNSRLAGIVIGLAVVFVVSLGAGLIVNTIQAKKDGTSDEDQAAMSVQTGTDEQGNVVTLPAEDSTEAECNILGIAPLSSFAAVLEGETCPLQISMTTKGQADAGDLLWESSDTAVAEITQDGIIKGVGAGECTIKVSAKADPTVSAQVRCAVRSMEEKDGVTYVDGILLINKTYGVDESYAPGGLTAETQAAFEELRADAMEEGLDIYISSGYRSYYDQDTIYNNYVGIYGWEVSDTFSARPGHSEHQSGLAIDVNTIDDAFAATPEAAWLKEHCAEYGFIIRYAEDKVDITGYKYEPWHIRYVGKETAAELTELGISLEEYLGVDSVYAEDWE